MPDMNEVMEILAQKGFDVTYAMEVCIDKDIYMDVLETALEEGGRKLPIMEESLAEKDYERYHVEVHGLKNAMKAIGAMELSELAFSQEKAAKEKNEELIIAGSGDLLQKYREVISILSELL